MMSLTSNDFLTTRAWHRAVVGGKDMILRNTSALEFLELFGGYMREKRIEVYAKKSDEYENIECYVVDSFNGIDHIRFGDVLCTSVNQTFNDMLSDFNSVDEQSLVEGLSRYYYTHGTSFNGLVIKPENVKYFNSVKDWAIKYHSEE
jgi:hypothetical protein